MTFERIRSKWLFFGSVALLLLLVLAAVAQYRWINRVSEADRRQREEFVGNTFRNFNGNFRETILSLLPYFRASPVAPDDSLERHLLTLTKLYLVNSDRPHLLSSVSIGTSDPSGIAFKRLRIGSDAFSTEKWPEELKLYSEILEKRLRMPGGELPLFPNGFAFELSEDRPVLVFPLVSVEGPTMRPGEGERPPPPVPESEPFGRGPSQGPPDARRFLELLRPSAPGEKVRVPQLLGWCFLEFDLQYLKTQLLPELVERHFGDQGLAEYHLAVVTGRPLNIIYKSDPGVTTGSLLPVDAALTIFDSQIQPVRPPPPPDGPPPPPQRGDDRPPPRGRPPGAGPDPYIAGRRPPLGLGPNPQGDLLGGDAKPWRLVMKYKAGSLEMLVNQARRRNLGFSFGVLLLFAGSTVMLGLVTQRARSLARQQMEFVAGVSHELRTPLTVIQSTSFNLSRGLIQDPNRVKKYGEVIQSEARRLINQVEQMLSFAGIQSGQRPYDIRPTEISGIIERTLSEYVGTFESGGWQVEIRIEKNLPVVSVDVQTLGSAIKNLVENALKYASGGKWLQVSVRTVMENRKGELELTVSDHGPGIQPADLPFIFEPFYRGKAVMGSSVYGAGLGLSLVDRYIRAHGGRVTVKSIIGGGTAFTIHLPISQHLNNGSKGGGHSNE